MKKITVFFPFDSTISFEKVTWKNEENTIVARRAGIIYTVAFPAFGIKKPAAHEISRMELK